MRRRVQVSGPFPPALARGPRADTDEARRAWMSACVAWSRATGHGLWKQYLPDAVRRRWAPSAKDRLRGVEWRS